MKLLEELPFFRRLARAAGARLFHWAENNGRADAARNGEHRWLDCLVRSWADSPQTEPRVVIDAGANAGDFSAAALAAAARHAVEIRVWLFEPAPACLGRLQERFGRDPRVRTVAAAVGAEDGVACLMSDVAGSEHASLHRAPAGANPGGTEVAVRALGPWLAEMGLPRVDFLKLDVEGAEHSALLGLRDRLDPQVVRCLQFEYGGTTLAARRSLGEIQSLLESKGYAVAKLLPGALHRRRYQPWMDHFTYANFVALPRPPER